MLKLKFLFQNDEVQEHEFDSPAKAVEFMKDKEINRIDGSSEDLDALHTWTVENVTQDVETVN
jgi:hypothetical protein